MLPIFPFLQKIGNISEAEMYTAFNMSIGMILVIPADEKLKVEAIVKKHASFKIYEIGKIISGTGKVILK